MAKKISGKRVIQILGGIAVLGIIGAFFIQVPEIDPRDLLPSRAVY